MANDKLEQYEEDIKILEQKLESERKNWDNVIFKAAGSLKSDVKNLYIVDADVINNKQLVTSEIRTYALMIHKENKNLKQLIKARFEFYSTSYQIVLKSSGDKMKLVEADIKVVQYKIDLLDSHISYLRDTNENFKQMGYSIKNRLELLNILGLD